MNRRRFYIPPDSIRDGIAFLPSDQAHHLRDVLRIRSGEEVEVFDGSGNGYAGAVAFQGSEVRVCRLQKLSSRESAISLILAVALIKSAKFELVLQKATELGVDEILPLNTLQSDIRIPEAKIPARIDRWNRIVLEASKQCRRFSSPRIHTPCDFGDFLKSAEFSGFPRYLFYEKSRSPWRPDPEMCAGKLVLCIGPEGGWEDREVELAGEAGCQVVSLGPWTLRAETASIAAVSILQHQIWLIQK
jgi:16S rRNA (uracil1498-N3)-methyltransferase